MFNPSLTEDNKCELILLKIFPKQPPILKSNRSIKHRKYIEEHHSRNLSTNEKSINLNGYLPIKQRKKNLNYLAVQKFYKDLNLIKPFLKNKNINKY